MNVDRYAAAESFNKLAMTFSPVPDLHIMWLLHLCDAHQEMQSWAEAAQCAVVVAGVVMQELFNLGEIVGTESRGLDYFWPCDGSRQFEPKANDLNSSNRSLFFCYLFKCYGIFDIIL
ncbi:guanine nucleotide exchange factor SPIKE 1 [Capsicum annuum]|uniref:guanine nucleotide exchange factor SPIKE 1 n=1 Tax=Capsicum annuum TaxID=4072 RepID=UPI0007BF2436|nr:guanine nucleotide exchange factor SPIKE 1 [Capsicum annuum]XP_047252744.1 guanine nucleotide exchange factor SPIKE 1 [Capsicum annuum]XP_047252745.1 guanine nucleotide exchange factor SPIKE 1 [Capsicum annuum]